MREVVESIEVMAAVDDAENSWGRFDDAWSAVKWVLSRDPTVGSPLTEGGRVRAFVYDGSWALDMPTIDVVYEITDSQIIIQRARFRDAGTSSGHA
jgi:hypothetical protein